MNQSSICAVCGKPLTDPNSIELGIGPVCRVTWKIKSIGEKTGNLFSNRSKYSYRIDGHLIAITDEGGMKTVTNDIDNIIDDLINDGIEVDNYFFIYKDSYGIWDGIVRGTTITFYSINEKNYFDAKKKVRYFDPEIPN